MPVWFIRVPANVVVLRRHVSHAAVVGICVVGLPVAVRPLWQLAQPAVMQVWSMRAPANDTVLLWQVSRGGLLTMCVAGCRSKLPASPHIRLRGRASTCVPTAV